MDQAPEAKIYNKQIKNKQFSNQRSNLVVHPVPVWRPFNVWDNGKGPNSAQQTYTLVPTAIAQAYQQLLPLPHSLQNSMQSNHHGTRVMSPSAKYRRNKWHAKQNNQNSHTHHNPNLGKITLPRTSFSASFSDNNHEGFIEKELGPRNENKHRNEEEWEVTSIQMNVEPLKLLTSSGSESEQWYIVVDTDVILNYFNFLYNMAAADPDCHLLIPRHVMLELQSHASDNNNVQAQRIFRFLKEQIQSGLAKLGEEVAGEGRFNMAIMTCVKLAALNNNVIFISNNPDTLKYKSNTKYIHVFTIHDVKDILANKPARLFRADSPTLAPDTRLEQTDDLRNTIPHEEIVDTNVVDNTSLSSLNVSLDTIRMKRIISMKRLTSINTTQAKSITSDTSKRSIKSEITQIVNRATSSSRSSYDNGGEGETNIIAAPNIIVEETSTLGVISNHSEIAKGPIKKDVKKVSLRSVVMYNIGSQSMEDVLSTRCDEWVFRFVQIMEKVLRVKLQEKLPFDDKQYPAPRDLQEAARSVLKKFSNNFSVVDAANKLSFILYKTSDENGKIAVNIQPSDYMEMYSYGVFLVETFQDMSADCKEKDCMKDKIKPKQNQTDSCSCHDVNAAYDSLTKLLYDIHQNANLETFVDHPRDLSADYNSMSEMNLRGRLSAQAQGGRPRGPHPAHQAMHAYHQMMGAYASNAFAANVANAGGRRSGGPRTPSPAPPPHQPPAPTAYHHQQRQQAKWHIPQHGLTDGGFEMSMMSPTGGGGASDFKITLSRAPPSSTVPAPPTAPRATAPPAPVVVTSTNPKTPSPSLNGGGGGGGGASMELDKVCAESVQDLMATIAKLDSNGVQPESQIYKDAKRLEEFFDDQLVKWLPEYAYWSGEGDTCDLKSF